MASENKTSFNLRFVPVKGYRSADKHQDPEHREQNLGYVHKERIHLNESWHKEFQANGHPKTLKNYLSDTKKVVKEKTGRNMQKKAEDKVIGEAVVVIDEHTTQQELEELGKRMEEKFKWTCVQIHIHKDEGYLGTRREDMKHREGKYNLHAHMFFITTDLSTGKSWKRKAGDGSVMQDITHVALGMARGVRKDKQKKAVHETLNVKDFKFGEIERTQNELNEKKERLERLEREVGELESSKEEAKTSLEQVKGELNDTNEEFTRVSNELERVKGDKEKELNALDSAKEELERVKDEREDVRKDVSELKDGYEKAINSFTKPKIEESVENHTKKGLKGMFGSKVNWEGVLSDYSKSASSYMAKLEAKIRECGKTIQQQKQTIQEKEKEKEEMLYGFKIEMNELKEELWKALGNPFKNFFNDMISFFGPLKNLLRMSVSLWNGGLWRNEEENHEYTADRDRGKLLINGETIEERNSRLSQEQEEQKRTQGQEKSRGIRL